MCIVVIALERHPRYPLIVAGNRDEFHERPALPGHFWPEAPAVLAGKDLRGGGTWLGLTRQLRWAVVSNIRGVASPPGPLLSRGQLVSGYLQSSRSAEAYLGSVYRHRHRFGPFNLLAGDGKAVWFTSSYRPLRRLDAGYYGLSNADLDTPWPKVERAKQSLQHVLAQAGEPLSPRALLPVLTDRSRPADAQLPSTGVGLEWERLLAPIFVTSANYGTRCSTVLMFSDAGNAQYFEQTYAHGEPLDAVEAQVQAT